MRSITVNETKDYGQTGHAEFYRAAEYTTKFVPMLRIEFAVASSQVESVSEAIAGAVQSGQIGDIKIFVLDLASEMVLRTSKNDGITPRQAA